MIELIIIAMILYFGIGFIFIYLCSKYVPFYSKKDQEYINKRYKQYHDAMDKLANSKGLTVHSYRYTQALGIVWSRDNIMEIICKNKKDQLIKINVILENGIAREVLT